MLLYIIILLYQLTSAISILYFILFFLLLLLWWSSIISPSSIHRRFTHHHNIIIIIVLLHKCCWVGIYPADASKKCMYARYLSAVLQAWKRWERYPIKTIWGYHWAFSIQMAVNWSITYQLAEQGLIFSTVNTVYTLYQWVKLVMENEKMCISLEELYHYPFAGAELLLVGLKLQAFPSTDNDSIHTNNVIISIWYNWKYKATNLSGSRSNEFGNVGTFSASHMTPTSTDSKQF